jgi:ProP effector
MTDTGRPPCAGDAGGRGSFVATTNDTSQKSRRRGRTQDSRRAAAGAAIALLAEQFPRAFALYELRRKPLKVGIDADIARVVNGAIKPHELSAALKLYTGNRGYLRNLRAGAARIDVDGNSAGVVTAEEAAHAAERLATRILRSSSRKAARPPTSPTTPAKPTVPRLGLRDLKAAWQRRQEKK